MLKIVVNHESISLEAGHTFIVPTSKGTPMWEWVGANCVIVTKDYLNDLKRRVGDEVPPATRLEVIDHRAGAPTIGRALVVNDAVVDPSWQDDGRTLKVFLADKDAQ